MEKIIRSVVFVAAVLSFSIASAQTKPLKIVESADWAEFTKKEKELYIAGILETFSFNLYGSSNPDLKPFVDCVERVGVERITNATQTMLLTGDSRNPLPWQVARALGLLCRR
jgi:hypothetical protein